MPAARGSVPEKVTALRKERRDVLRQALNEAEKAYQSGHLSFWPIQQITINLIDAELDLAHDRAERVAIRERAVDEFKAMEKVAADFEKLSLLQKPALLQTRAARLQSEIDLLCELGDEK